MYQETIRISNLDNKTYCLSFDCWLQIPCHRKHLHYPFLKLEHCSEMLTTSLPVTQKHKLEADFCMNGAEVVILYITQGS